ncbi:Serine palmitoyltransferase 1, partial [Smittium culicis]
MSVSQIILVALVSGVSAEISQQSNHESPKNNVTNESKLGFLGIGARFVIRYIKSSYRDDPFRTFLELLLILFIAWYISRNKYKMNQTDIKLSEKEIDDLISEWKPEPLSIALTKHEQEVLD